MSARRTYLDWNATAPLRPEAREAAVAALDVVGNPSSPHAEGRRARAIIEDAREKVAALVGATPAEVVFTSGGTEANNAVLAAGWDTIVLSGIEHDSVLVPARDGRARVVEMPVGRSGVVGVDAPLADHVSAGRSLLSLQMANNETGVVQPVAAVAAAARAQGFFVHTDAVQAAGRVPVDVRSLGVDCLTLSAHKIGGPKGVGALVIHERASLPAFIAGGGQERRRRAGTENVAAIAGFGAAAEAARGDLARMGRLRVLRDRLEGEVCALTPAAVVIGAEAARLPNTAAIALAGVSAETLVIALDLAGIAVSAGAACSSGKVGTSHVLEAMGLEKSLARAAIRVSLGWSSTQSDIGAFVAAWGRIAQRHRERAVA
ncbi:MAG: cysteine desulfurase [Hyphomonadaceae bacterium]|nr:cysteine desulfurase [Hyphomonadaceae bacterium]